MSDHGDYCGWCDECNNELAALRAQVEELRKALEDIADRPCTGIGSPPGCDCRTCVARRALASSPVHPNKGGAEE
jgi:hypothetical protein